MSGTVCSTIAVIVAIVIFVWMTMNNYNIIIGSLVGAAIVAVFCIDGFVEGFFNIFVSGTLDFLSNMLLMFVTGAIFGGLLNVTGCNERIAKTFIKWLGKERIIYVIFLLSLIIPLTGASHIIIVAYISLSLMHYADLPRYIALVAMIGSQYIAQSMLPGSLMIGTVLPTMFIGTTVYAAPVLGIVTGVISFIGILIYVKYLIRQARKNNIGYDPYEGENVVMAELNDDTGLPSFAFALAPIILIIGAVFVLVLGFNVQSNQAVIYASILSSLFMIITNYGKLKSIAPLGRILSDTITPMLPVIVGTPMVVGFASVVQDTTFFTSAVGWLMDLNINPYLLVVLGTNVLCAICADSMGGIGTFMSTLAPRIIETFGVSAEVVHRLSLISGTVFETLPHNGGVCFALSMFRYSHKEAYKYIAVSTILIPGIMCIIALILCVLFY